LRRSGVGFGESSVDLNVTSDVDVSSRGKSIDGDGGGEGDLAGGGISLVELKSLETVLNGSRGGGSLEELAGAEVDGVISEELVKNLGLSLNSPVSDISLVSNLSSDFRSDSRFSLRRQDSDVGVSGRIELEGSLTSESNSVSELSALSRSSVGTVGRESSDSLNRYAPEIGDEIRGKSLVLSSRNGNLNVSDHWVLARSRESNPPNDNPGNYDSENRESSKGEVKSLVGSSTVSRSKLNEEESSTEGGSNGDTEEETPNSELGERVEEGVSEHVAASKIEARLLMGVLGGGLGIVVLLIFPNVDLEWLRARERVLVVDKGKVLVASHVLDEVSGEIVHVVSAVASKNGVGVGGLSKDDTGDVEGDEGSDEEKDTIDVVSGGETSDVEEDSNESEDG
jgi:hypothetical protein